MSSNPPQDSSPFSGTAPVQERHRFDIAALEAYLAKHIEGFSGPLEVEQFRGGQSNPTYRLSAGARRYVMRAKPGPAAKLLPSAHAIDREYRVMTALAKAGIPVPQTFCLCEDESVIGRAFMVMDCVEGRIFWQQDLPGLAPSERAALYEEMNRVLAALHGADYKAIGLEDYGRPGNYFARQIGRWSKQYLDDTEAGRDPNLDKLAEWLPAHTPAGDETTLVHGDFRIDNMIFHPTEPRILAVIDWELATLGHPLADFSYHLMTYRLPPLVIAGLVGADLAALNIPSEDAYVAAYCHRTGRDRIDHLDFYIAYNLFRLGAIIHGIKGRMLRGTAASPNAREMVAALPVIAELGWQQAARSR